MKKSEGPDLKKQIFVIGAGASGLMAAIQAAVYGAAVTVLEQNDRPGRKICATGNGRCNMTNLNQDENAYRGSHPEFAKDALAQFPVENSEILSGTGNLYHRPQRMDLSPKQPGTECGRCSCHEGTQPEGKAENQSDRYRRVFCRRTVEDPYGRMDLQW